MHQYQAVNVCCKISFIALVPAEPETETKSDPDFGKDEEVSLEVLREKLKFLESRMGLDAEVLVALNRDQILQNFFLPRLLHHFICQFFKLLMTVTDKNDLDKATPQLFHMAPSYKQNFPVKLRFARFERSDWLLHFV